MQQGHFLGAQRRFIWCLTLGFAALVAWAFLGRVDIVAVSQGKLIPSSTVQVGQLADSGVIHRVLVKDGDLVKAGQPLIELDALVAEEAFTAARAEATSLGNQLQRLDAELQGRAPAVNDPSVLAEYRSRTEAQAALLNEALRHRDSAESELRAAQARLRKYQALSPVTARQADMLENLRTSGFVSEAALNEKLLAKIDTDREVTVQERAVASAEAALRQAEAGVTKVRATYQQQLAVERNDLLLRQAKADSTVKQSEHRASLQVLRAPVAGRVTGSTVFTPGKVIAAGETLLSIVPAGEPLQFEGWLRNEDASFVVPGMPVKAKLAAYPFQKYGWLEGELTWLGVDAETPTSMKNAQGEPLFYRVRVKLKEQTLGVDGKRLELRAGLQGVADVHVGTRTIFEYLTSPLRKIALEAARER